MVGMYHPVPATNHQLSDIAGVADISVVRDGGFLNLGFVQHQEHQMLVFLESDRYLAALQRNQHVSAVLTRPDLLPLIRDGLGVGICRQPRLAFAAVHNQLPNSRFYWQGFPSLIPPLAGRPPPARVAAPKLRDRHLPALEPHPTGLD